MASPSCQSWMALACHHSGARCELLLRRRCPRIACGCRSGHVRPRQGTEICIRAAVSTAFFEVSPVENFVFPEFLCNSVRNHVDKLARFPGGEKA